MTSAIGVNWIPAEDDLQHRKHHPCVKQDTKTAAREILKILFGYNICSFHCDSHDVTTSISQWKCIIYHKPLWSSSQKPPKSSTNSQFNRYFTVSDMEDYVISHILYSITVLHRTSFKGIVKMSKCFLSRIQLYILYTYNGFPSEASL